MDASGAAAGHQIVDHLNMRAMQPLRTDEPHI
jgi:hypothetical protein